MSAPLRRLLRIVETKAEVGPRQTWTTEMAFPDDLADILPLPPGTGVTRRFQIFGHVVFVSVKMREDGRYRLHVYDRHEGLTRERYQVEGLESEDEVEDAWERFLDQRESIFKNDPGSLTVK
jgi:hypothetical protein